MMRLPPSWRGSNLVLGSRLASPERIDIVRSDQGGKREAKPAAEARRDE
jgi:hypothetical protein